MSPNLMLCLVVIFSFLIDGYHGVVFGILFGLLNDFCFGEIIGIGPFSYFLSALVCIEMKRYLYKDSLISLFLVSLGGSSVYALVYFGLYKMLGYAYDFVYVLEKNGVMIVYNMMITLILYLILSRKVIKHRSDRYMYRGNLQEARSLYKS